MTNEQEERLVMAFELIAQSMAGIHETKRKEFEKRWPSPGERREAVVTRVLSEEDRIREKHGEEGGSIADWLGLEEEFIGVREKEFIKSDARRKQVGGTAGGFAAAPKKTNNGTCSLGSETLEGEA